MPNDDLLDQVRDLRGAGRSPKEIARILGARPSTVSPLLRVIAAEANAARTEPPVVGCWVSPGWRQSLTVEGHPDWPDVEVLLADHEGLVQVAVARSDRPHRVSVCGYLVDVFCLGVKNAIGPAVIDQGRLPTVIPSLFAAFEELGDPLEAPIGLARHLIWGAVDYARSLGFEPAPAFAQTSGHLGTWDETSDITFGRNGVPFYNEGPYDNTPSVIRTLRKSVGDGNFHYLAEAHF